MTFQWNGEYEENKYVITEIMRKVCKNCGYRYGMHSDDVCPIDIN